MKASLNLWILVSSYCSEDGLGEGEALHRAPADRVRVLRLDHVKSRDVAMHGEQDGLMAR